MQQPCLLQMHIAQAVLHCHATNGVLNLHGSLLACAPHRAQAAPKDVLLLRRGHARRAKGAVGPGSFCAEL